MRERSPGRSASQPASGPPSGATELQGLPSGFGSASDPSWVLFENHPRALLLYDPESFQILAVNQAALDLHGYTRDELLAMTVGEIRPPEDLPRFQKHLRATAAGQRISSGLWRHRRKDGTDVLVEVSAAEMLLMGRTVRLAAIQDVTDRERMRVALRDSEARKTAILNAVQDAVVASDLEGRIVEFNPAAERMFGYSRQEILGRQVEETIVPPYMRSRHQRAMANYVATGEHRMIGRTAEMTGVRADGSEFPIEITLEVILVGGQKGFTTYIRDLTEKKAAEALYAAGIGVAGVLAEAVRFEDVAYSALRTICQALDWELGGIWILDEAAQVLRLTDFWHASDVDAAPFEQESRRRVFSRGLGLPGLTWERGGPVWIPEVFAEHGCPRYELATRCGFKSAAAFPIRAGGEILGVAEFFAREMAEPDQGMQDLFNALGSRIGQFLQRSREEERHRGTVLMLESVLHHSPLGILLIDPDLTVKFWSRAMEDIFGWTAKEMVGMPYTLVVPEEHREQFRKHYHTVLAGRDFMSSESWRLRKDGSPAHVSISGGPVHDAQGRLVGIVGVYADLTRPKPVV